MEPEASRDALGLATTRPPTRTQGATTQLDEAALEQLLDEVGYRSGSRRNVLLTHLYRGERRAGHVEYEVDHIFPRTKLSDEKYLQQHDVGPERIEWYADHRNHIANLQLLRSDGANQSKGDRTFSEWVARVDSGDVGDVTATAAYFDTHRIPRDETTHEFSQFERFVTERTALIKETLMQTLPVCRS